ncbi:hypothetical protein HL653_02235 [Sphingomonas sp. AP4-R1]|uniref:hypothetical protein n=1 Tax=Sphingomonas sp. AP4-R1 TaxID=2735134 RepID=UPI001493BE4C|nr:hypothetical protein [Sphingomonas sp. AP4-R1]QJU56761.1 hypothetical protein HL653_02235 [Sphingomonas sp. AP4-R1]
MTLDTFFLLLVPTYLVLIAYGQVGARKRRLAPRMRGITAAIRVMLPPVVLIGTLAWEGDTGLLRAWLPVVIGMAVAGAIVAAAVEVVAPRVGA